MGLPLVAAALFHLTAGMCASSRLQIALRIGQAVRTLGQAQTRHIMACTDLTEEHGLAFLSLIVDDAGPECKWIIGAARRSLGDWENIASVGFDNGRLRAARSSAVWNWAPSR